MLGGLTRFTSSALLIIHTEVFQHGFLWFRRCHETTVLDSFSFKAEYYLEGQDHVVIRLITPKTHILTLIIHIVNLLTESP